MSSISYAITVCNEFEEIRKLLDLLKQNICRSTDEIIVLVDRPKASEELCKFLCKESESSSGSITILYSEFKGDFAEWKNKLTSYCTGDYIFQIDADEIVSSYLLENLHKILDNNPTTEHIYVPRVNTVEGLTQEDINRWGWNVDERGRVNWPDYQGRIYKNKYPRIRWEGKVHEHIQGAGYFSKLPADSKFCLIHEKTIERQRKQNTLYDELQK